MLPTFARSRSNRTTRQSISRGELTAPLIFCPHSHNRRVGDFRGFTYSSPCHSLGKSFRPLTRGGRQVSRTPQNQAFPACLIQRHAHLYELRGGCFGFSGCQFVWHDGILLRKTESDRLAQSDRVVHCTFIRVSRIIRYALGAMPVSPMNGRSLAIMRNTTMARKPAIRPTRMA